MLQEATQQLLSTLRSPDVTETQLRDAAQSFINAALNADDSEARAALGALSSAFSLDDLQRGAFAALIGGALLEHGGDPAPLAEPLIELLRRHLELTGSLAAECERRIQPELDDEADPAERFEQMLANVAGEMPREAEGWEALETSWCVGVTLFSVSSEARNAGKPLRALAERSAEFHTGSSWLSQILAVLDDEPFLVIEPDTGLGIKGRMRGVVDNFQLHTLLMDVFPQRGPFSKGRLARPVVEIARGIGPQQSDQAVTGEWNLYAWTAVSPDLTLPQATDTGARQHWIWGEGKPEDIPLFEGQRVILLGPASYVRSWPSQRMFNLLKADLIVEATLSGKACGAWLERMAGAPRPV